MACTARPKARTDASWRTRITAPSAFEGFIHVSSGSLIRIAMNNRC
jgi:hypothetical protein